MPRQGEQEFTNIEGRVVAKAESGVPNIRKPNDTDIDELSFPEQMGILAMKGSYRFHVKDHIKGIMYLGNSTD